MPQLRRLLDTVVKRMSPGFDAGYRPPPIRLADGVWSLERRLRMPGGPVLPSRTAIIRSEGDKLALISPPPPHEETFAMIEALGAVAAVVAPNSFHYLYIGDAMRRFQDARLYLAPGLQERIATLPPGTELSDGLPPADLEQVTLRPPHGVSEAMLFHRPSRILILNDVAFNLVNIDRVVDRVFWRAFGVPAEFGPSRTAKLMLLNDRAVVRQALRQVLEWPFERIHVAHGEVVQTDARARFERAFAAYL